MAVPTVAAVVAVSAAAAAGDSLVLFNSAAVSVATIAAADSPLSKPEGHMSLAIIIGGPRFTAPTTFNSPARQA